MLHFLSHCHFYVFFLSTTGKITQFAQPYGQDASNRINYGEFSTPLLYISLAVISWCKVARSLNNEKPSMVSPHWSALLTWEGHCKAHLIVLHIFWLHLRWGTRYDYGNEDVHMTLVDFAMQKLLSILKDSDLTQSQMYAILSQHLVLDANTPQYLFCSTNPL